MTLAEFAWAVYAYCTLTGASVTSWVRTRARNDLLRGVAHSPHLIGLGADVVYDEPLGDVERREWARRLRLVLVTEPDHDHLQPEGWRPG